MKMSNKSTNNTKNSRPSMCLNIPSQIYDKIMYWVDKTSHEVSWWGLLDYDKESNVFTVMDVFLLDQEVSGTSTEISANAIHKLMFETRDSPYMLRWWGHSHVKMDVFWSGTDMNTMTENSTGGWLLSTVFNQKREMRTAFCQDIPISVFMDNVQTKIISSKNEQWDEEFEQKVKTKNYSRSNSAQMYSEYKWARQAREAREFESDSQEELIKAIKKAQAKEKDLLEEVIDIEDFMSNDVSEEDMRWWHVQMKNYRK